MLLLCLLFFFSFNSQAQESELLICREGYVHFKSDAPLELIQASSRELAGVINCENLTFAYTIPINSFEGFNSPLQKEHFREFGRRGR